MIKKKRITIPSNIAAEALFQSDRTCCVCNTKGKPVQIHHIDENPANNEISNLSVLCFECHEQTMIKGGFSRKLDSAQIIKYRNDWQERVKIRKEKADELASIQSVTGKGLKEIEPTVVTDSEELDDDLLIYKTNNDPTLLKEYLDKILIIHQAQIAIAQTKWDTGITSEMNQGSYDMVDFYEEVLVELSTFYPKGHFENKLPKKYFSEVISSRFLWHRLVLEPNGHGTGGTIISTMTGGQVMEDLRQMIVDMVSALLFPYDLGHKVNFDKWRDEWSK